jgi:protein-S-isoprenylcysteine O-methyltransferase Ste14
VGDLLTDVRQLMRQELALAKHEIHGEIRKATSASIALGAGIGLAALGGLLFIIAVVHLLQAVTDLPLWACYGIVAGLCAVVGFILLYLGKRQMSQIEIVPQQTVETMRENVKWMKKNAIAE